MAVPVARVRGECGYSVAELLVAIAVVGAVSAAVFSIYLVSVQANTRARSLEEAQTSARAGIDRMTTELRLIGAFWAGHTGATASITTMSATGLTFVGDVDGDTLDASGNEVTLASAAAIGATSITVDRTAGRDGSNAFTAGEFVYVANGATREVRQIGVAYTSGTTLPLATALTNAYPVGSIVRSVETVTYAFNAGAATLTRSQGSGAAEIIAGSVVSLALTYLDSANAVTTDPSLVREIRATVTTSGLGGTRRTLTSQVKPWNVDLQ